MNELDASSFALDPRDREDAASAAFDRLGRRVANLTAAVEGFAVRQEAIQARDNGPVIEKIDKRFLQVRDALVTLDKRPGLRMTVEGIAGDIEGAGRKARAADHDALAQARHEFVTSRQALDRMVAGKIDLRRQACWLAAAAATCLIVGVIIGDIVPPMIDRAAPASWQWPEERAADDLAMSANDAGQRLLRLSDPAGWYDLVEAQRLIQANKAAISACRARQATRGATVDCSIVVDR